MAVLLSGSSRRHAYDTAYPVHRLPATSLSAAPPNFPVRRFHRHWRKCSTGVGGVKRRTDEEWHIDRHLDGGRLPRVACLSLEHA